MLRCYLRAALPPPRSSLGEDAIAVFVAIEEEAQAFGAEAGTTLAALVARTLLPPDAIVAAARILADAHMIRMEDDGRAPLDADGTLPPPPGVSPAELEPEGPSTRVTMSGIGSFEGRAAALYAVELAGLSEAERLRIAASGEVDLLEALAFDPSVAVRDALLAQRALPKRALERLVLSFDPRGQCARAEQAASETVRAAFAEALRHAFSHADPDGRIALLLGTEGAVLAHLGAAILDVPTTQRLVAQPDLPPTLARRLAAFRGAPPILVTYLAGLAVAREDAATRAALLAHPNLPPTRKRALELT